MRSRNLRWAIPLVCVLAGVGALAGCTKEKAAPPKPVPTVSQVFQEGVEHLRRNEIDAAINTFSLIVEKARPEAPERPLAHLYLGQIAYRAGNMDLAVSNFKAALELNPDIPQARLSLGNAHFAAGRIDEAVAAWEQLARDRPNLASVHNNLAIAYMDRGELDKAITQLEQTIALSPENYRAHENLAEAYRKKGMAAEAEAAEHKAQAIKSRLLARQKGAGSEPGTSTDQRLEDAQ